jgi:DNA-binding beta-propeller fold protein YncE
MKRFSFSIFYVLASFIMLSSLGCGSNIQHIPTTVTIVEPNRIYNASFDKVWAASLQALSDEGTLKVIDKSGGIIVTEPKTIDSKELSILSTTFLGKTYKSNYTINVKEIASDKTDVKVNVKLQAVQVGFFTREEKLDNVENYLREKLFKKISSNLRG